LFQVVHQEQHLGERAYAEDWWTAGEHQPRLVTAFSMDAPTETQFDLPVQKRSAKDAVKALDSAKKWSSKITGLMMAGHGMLAYVSRDGLGSGPNLSCTVLYLSLLFMVAEGRPIGEKFNLLLDNTSGTLIPNPLS
jgi:L-aminopeptidase/D-esterase-like protein|tara:strand:+ start:120 stop:527 length:408 start_codon:yes stop_codon:yes gene_type:complete